MHIRNRKTFAVDTVHTRTPVPSISGRTTDKKLTDGGIITRIERVVGVDYRTPRVSASTFQSPEAVIPRSSSLTADTNF